MNHRKLLEFFDARRDAGRALVLATVYETAGSTYSKAGGQMLIDADGFFHGMLSGGCLEGDLAIRSRAVLESGAPQRVTYDLSLDNDDLWGLGVGCDGLMRVFLQPLKPESDYAPFTAIATLRRGHRRGLVATVIDPGSGDVPAGAAAVTDGDFCSVSGVDGRVADELRQVANDALSLPRGELRRVALNGADTDLLCAIADTVPRMLILGAGLDAQPVLKFGTELGWQCTVADHRAGYLQRGDLGDAVETLCVPAESLRDAVDLDAFDAAIVMSHHLVSDEHYLSALAGSAVPYVGLLGPPARRERLMDSLGDVARALDGRLHGPAGLDLGGRGPAAIALSIVAEMQRHVSARSEDS
jgi:xanthine/CO dehydrogenase XdhC/CoxF family maturation factor